MMIKMIYTITLYVIFPLLTLCVLLFSGAFFAATETAYTALSKITVRQMLKDKVQNASLVFKLKNNLDVLISTSLVGTNFITTLTSSLTTAYAVNVFGKQYVSYATALVTIFVIIFSEIIPKTYAAVRSEKCASNSALAILIIQKIFFPIVFIFGQLSAFINFAERKLIKKKTPLVTEEELKTLIEIGETEGTLESDERKMLDRIFEFSDLRVSDIMRHRSLVTYINVHSAIEEVTKAFHDSGYSRLPVYQDTRENVVGVLHYKAVLFAGPEIIKSKDFIRICMRPIMHIPETMTAVELLKRFKSEKSNFAVALNEYGGTSGIVTMDDILREVFGRMTDEYGMSEIPAEKRIAVVGTNEFIIPGDMKLDDLNDVLNINLDSEYSETLGGWLLERFGELPTIGAIYKSPRALYIVEDQSARRIQSVRLRLL